MIWRRREPPRHKVVSLTGSALFILSVVLFAFPHSIHRPIVSLGILPVAAILLSMGALARLVSSDQPRLCLWRRLFDALPDPQCKRIDSQSEAVMSVQARSWRSFHNRNPRDRSIAELWVRDLAAYLRELPWLDSTRSVLDFGCGFFDLGLAIAGHIGRVDGIDISPHAVEISRARTRHLAHTAVYSDARQLPADTYLSRW